MVGREAAASSSVSMQYSQLGESDSDTKSKPKRYALGMYVDMDTHMLGLYSIIRQAINTGMVEQGVEVVVAVSQHMVPNWPVPAKPETTNEKLLESIQNHHESVGSQVEEISAIRASISETSAKISKLNKELVTLKRTNGSDVEKAGLEKSIEALAKELQALTAAQKAALDKVQSAISNLEGAALDLGQEEQRKIDKPKQKKKETQMEKSLRAWLDEGLVHKVVPVDKDFIKDKVKGRNLWDGVFNKLIFHNFTEYDKIIRLDCDILIRQNLYHWFDYETPCAIQAHDEIEFNSGVMVITPNNTVFEAMMDKLPEVQRLDHNKIKPGDNDTWNSGVGEQGFMSSFFTTSTDYHERMKTMSTEDAVTISSLNKARMKYFWYHRDHIFLTIHLTTEKPWRNDCHPGNEISCDVLREWALSTEGLEDYNLTVSHKGFNSTQPYLRDCGNATSPVVPAYQRHPRPTWSWRQGDSR